MERDRKAPLVILQLEDNPLDVELLKAKLTAEGIAGRVIAVRGKEDFEAALTHSPFDLIISDFTIPGYNGLAALEAAQEKAPDRPFIFLSGTIGEEAAVEALRKGAKDYVLKDRQDRLGSVIRRVLSEADEQIERQRVLARMKEQAALLDLTQEAILVADLDGRLRYWNKGAERLHGWTSEEALGRFVTDFLYHDPSWFMGALEKLLYADHWKAEIATKTKAGAVVLVEARWTLVRDTHGEPKSILATASDITDKRKLEEQFFRSQRLEGIGALAGGIAHDLNNVLTPIQMAGQLMNGDLAPEDRKQMVATVLGCARRGSELVERIVSFARGVGGEKRPVQPGSVIGEMARLAKATFPRSIEMVVIVEADLPEILANATQVHQVLLNLCVNARDAMPEGGEIRLEARKVKFDEYRTKWELEAVSGDYVAISVSDQGAGIATEMLDKIFEPFFTTKAEGKGTGLGLSTVQGIVKNHNGFVEVVSEPRKGTTFTAYFPIGKN